MHRTALTCCLATALLAAGAVSAQTSQPPAAAKSPAAASQSQSRPDAKYPHPSGQDSPTNKKSPTSSTTPPTTSTKQGVGTVEKRGTKARDETPRVRKLANQKGYTGATGSKADPGTACSTARPTKNGGVDCGTSGDSATLGRVVTKPH
jgi:hypothetical protein